MKLRCHPSRAVKRPSVSLLSFVAVVGVTLLTQDCAARKDRNQPHPYKTTLKAYQPGPFDIALTSADEAKLRDGQPVTKQTMPSKDDPEAGGGAICIQDVAAPPSLVWDQILNLNAYKGKVPKVLESHNYYTQRNPDDNTERIKTKMVLGVLPGYNYESYYDHTYYSDKDSLTWKLDADKTSDFEDVSGHWHVEPHPTLGGDCASRVFYACDIKMVGNVPGPILNYISKAALRQATGWVKKESEREAKAQGLDTSSNTANDPSPSSSSSSDESVVPEPALKKRRFAFGLGNP